MSSKVQQKAKKPSTHPTYAVMIVAAIKALKNRKGSTKQAILLYIRKSYDVQGNANSHTKVALRRLLAKGDVVHVGGRTGLLGRFALSAAALQTKTQKKSSPKKLKKAVKKQTSPKKSAAKKSPKKKKQTTAKKQAKSPAKKKAASKPKQKKAAAKPKTPKKQSVKKVTKKPAAKKTATKKPAAQKKRKGKK